MRKRSSFKHNVKLVLGRWNTALTVALLVVMVLSTVALAGLYAAIQSARDQEFENRAAAIRLEQENQDLENRIEHLGSADSFWEIARQELGLEDPNALILDMEDAE